MKILQVCLKPPYPPRDGGSMAMFGLACSLSRMGHEITVLTMYTPKHKLSDEDKLRFGDFMEVQTVYVDTTVHLTALLKNLLFSDKPYNALRFVSAEFENKLVNMLSAKTYDIVQLEGLYLVPYIPAIRRHSKGLVALRAHNVEHEIWQRLALSEKNLYRKWYFKTLAKRILHFESEIMNRYDLLVPITERDLGHFNRMGNTSSAYVCPAGVDIDPAPSGETIRRAPKYDFSIFFLGSLDWMPNQEGLLWFVSKVFPELHHRNPGLKFHIAGRNLPDKLLQKLKKPGLVVHGEITDAAKFMKTYGIMVAPCFSGSGMRVKVIEAMATGKPVVTTPLGAEGLPVRHGKNIILATRADEFLHQTEKLLKYPDFYQKIGQNAYNFVSKKFNNTTLASGLADFYKMNLK